MQKDRIEWIDFLRGVFMVMILVFHTEVYYKEYSVTPYYIYVTNAIILFYFLSGYLFHRNRPFNLKAKLASIVKSLLFPYFVFTLLISIAKLLFLKEGRGWSEMFISIISGRASWFIAALIVAEVLFSVLLFISKGKQWWLSTVALLCLIIYYLIPFNQHNYWQWQDALLAVTFLYAGYTYHQYEDVINRIHKPLYSLLLFLILILIKVYEYHVDLPMRNISVECAPLFLCDALVTILFVIGLIRLIPRCHLIEWTGRHCIVYYFLCGGCPLIASRVLVRFGIDYDGMFLRFILALILTYALNTCLTWIIFRYFPFIVKIK